MPGLPLLLAGPIVRRVTARSVSVWVALSEGADVTLSIWNKVVSAGTDDGVLVPPDAPLHTATKHTIRIGDKLHIVVVTIDVPAAPAPPLFPGMLYSYNVSLAAASGNADLKSLKLLVDKFPEPATPIRHLALGYLAGVLPSFVLPPPTIDKVNLAHGSCRKAHGPGKDSLAALDSTIRKAVNANDPEQRPHLLILTGDQIYADEVPTVLITNINALGAQLLGPKENLTAKKKDGTVAAYEASMANFPATRRQRITERSAKFTSSAAENHLLSFGEFAATYLMYFSNAAWPVDLFAPTKDLKAKDDFLATWDTDPLTAVEQELAPPTAAEQAQFAKEKPEDKEKRKRRNKEHAQDAYEDDLSEVITFRDQLPNVRRVLANIPVYMIMDDHEVTDDWYVSKDWRDKVLSSPLGVNILRNALMAYTLFQDWGNDPATYSGGSKADLLNRLQQVFPTGSASGPATAAADAIDHLFGFDLADETAPPVKWHYSVPCSETTVYVLDTRTRRTYETRYSPPGLLSDGAMDDQIPLAAQPEHFLVFVSPAPVLGLGTFEELLQPVMTVFSQYAADPEPWSFAPVTFEKFLSRLQPFKRVVLLSGDVHFGAAAVMDYWRKNEPAPARFVQFISSGVKNQKFAQERFLGAGFVQQLLGSLFYPGERLGWKLRGVHATNPAGTPNPPAHRIRLRREPVLLPTRGWPAGTTVTQPSDWSWRLRFSADPRPDDSSPDARPEKIRIADVQPDVNLSVGDAHAAYQKVLARHLDVFKKAAARRVVWDSNVGVIKFERDGAGNVTAVQELLYWMPDDETTEEPDAYTAYSEILEPTADKPPVIT